MTVLRVMALIIPMIVLNAALVSQWMVPQKLDRALLAVIVSGTALNLALAAFFATRYGALGMAWVTVAVEAYILSGLLLALYRRGLRPIAPQLLPSLVRDVVAQIEEARQALIARCVRSRAAGRTAPVADRIDTLGARRLRGAGSGKAAARLRNPGASLSRPGSLEAEALLGLVRSCAAARPPLASKMASVRSNDATAAARREPAAGPRARQQLALASVARIGDGRAHQDRRGSRAPRLICRHPRRRPRRPRAYLSRAAWRGPSRRPRDAPTVAGR